MENTYNNFGSKSFLDHRDPLLLGPPLRLDPQSYSALSDYLLTYSYTLVFGSVSAIVLVHVPLSRWFFATSLDDAVPFFDRGPHIG